MKQSPCLRIRYDTDSDKNGWGVNKTPDKYLAVVCGELPRETRRDDYAVRHGYALGLGYEFPVCFFHALEPAIVAGRAMRMGAMCSGGWGVSRAAHIVKWCSRHDEDERILLIASGSAWGSTWGDEGEEYSIHEICQSWVNGIDERSSNWHPEYRIDERGYRKKRTGWEPARNLFDANQLSK
jgi:hypothetical protein